MVRQRDRAQRESTQIEGYQMASTCSCTHTAVFFRCSRTDTQWPFLLLMHRFLFSGYLVLIYSPSLPPLKELAADLLPLSCSLSHTPSPLSIPPFAPFLCSLPFHILAPAYLSSSTFMLILLPITFFHLSVPHFPASLSPPLPHV